MENLDKIDILYITFNITYYTNLSRARDSEHCEKGDKSKIGTNSE